MKYGILRATTILTLSLSLAACGQSDRDVIISACTSDTLSAELCECTTDVMYETLSPQFMKEAAASIRSGDQTPQDVIAALSEAEDQKAVMTFFIRAMPCNEK